MFNYGFELFVNLFQGVMFTVFCYKFLTPSRNKICEGIAFCVASLLMFLSITQITGCMYLLRILKRLYSLQL